MKPLIEMAEGPVPILSKEQISSLFGPLPKLLVYHELFYTALTSRTMEWSPVQRVGDIFMSTVSGWGHMITSLLHHRCFVCSNSSTRSHQVCTVPVCLCV